ncbi:unnamed protein product [Cuscuta epithymum]|uniref:Uncharacterized protein n=1 Tax=Cuscuta epithymum TaxID=186058 RepID=A0AAV0G980_9ASTE|nr:unnamed protein product [Cuscuta epithymum]
MQHIRTKDMLTTKGITSDSTTNECRSQSAGSTSNYSKLKKKTQKCNKYERRLCSPWKASPWIQLQTNARSQSAISTSNYSTPFHFEATQLREWEAPYRVYGLRFTAHSLLDTQFSKPITPLKISQAISEVAPQRMEKTAMFVHSPQRPPPQRWHLGHRSQKIIQKQGQHCTWGAPLHLGHRHCLITTINTPFGGSDKGLDSH